MQAASSVRLAENRCCQLHLDNRQVNQLLQYLLCSVKENEIKKKDLLLKENIYCWHEVKKRIWERRSWECSLDVFSADRMTCVSSKNELITILNVWRDEPENTYVLSARWIISRFTFWNYDTKGLNYINLNKKKKIWLVWVHAAKFLIIIIHYFNHYFRLLYTVCIGH